MKIQNQRKYINKKGEPTTEFDCAESEFETIVLRRISQDELVVRATKESGEEVEHEVHLTGELFKAVDSPDVDRRDIPDDIQDLMLLDGYAADTGTEES